MVEINIIVYIQTKRDSEQIFLLGLFACALCRLNVIDVKTGP